ncbi:hypothetical protein Acr_11g0002220 [Actinidia rufa]|uniref:Uncharacterized protein n=1 Tax=Actinidia rufa TaxID=165716 RepID=A0A7J0FBW9_9ERIC|nr:hypothetical protein Acr_11g0002220 [Actinidia rufa]
MGRQLKGEKNECKKRATIDEAEFEPSGGGDVVKDMGEVSEATGPGHSPGVGHSLGSRRTDPQV